MILALLKARAWLTGLSAQAIAATIVVALVVGGIVGGLWWLRADARADGRAQCEASMDAAHIADLKSQLEAARASEAISRKAAEEWERTALEADAARQSIQDLLAARGRVIVYPREIVKALNK